MNYDSDTHHFDCDCSSAEHIFRVTSENAFDEDFPPQLYISLQLNQYRNLLKRLLTAVKYFFGYECKYGHWDTVELKKDDINRLMVLLHQHRIKIQKFEMEKENDRKPQPRIRAVTTV
jgi:hypothetical protein